MVEGEEEEPEKENGAGGRGKKLIENRAKGVYTKETGRGEGKKRKERMRKVKCENRPKDAKETSGKVEG